MPEETEISVRWATNQEGVAKEEPWTIVDKVREYFNLNNIEYSNFSFDDLIPYLD